MRYPSIGYDFERKWSAYGFGLLTKMAEFRETRKQSKDSIEVRRQRSERFQSELDSRFPPREAIWKTISKKRWRSCQNFTYLPTAMHFNIKGTRVIIDCESSNICPSLILELKNTFLESDLGNAQNPNLAIPMWMYGLSALGTVYKAYGMDNKFLPSIDFYRNNFVFEVPFLKQKFSGKKMEVIEKSTQSCIEILPDDLEYSLSKPYENFSVEKNEVRVVPFQSQNTSHKFVGQVRYKSGDYINRNNVAANMFILATWQAHESYRMRDVKEK